MWLGDFPEDFTSVTCMFTSHSSTGAPVAPSSAFEAADVLIYKNGNAAQKTTANGVTMTSPFDSVTGLHCVVIDTSNDTGDSGFWVSGAVYTLVLSPDETVDGVAVAKVIGQFGLALAGTPLTAAGVRSAVGLAASNLDDQLSAIDTVVDAIKAKTDNLPSDPADASVVAGLIAALEAKVDTVDTVADAIKLKTDNLPSDPADASVIAGLIGGVDTKIDTLDTVADAIQAKTDLIPGTQDGKTFAELVVLMAAVLLGKASGLATTTAVFRSIDDSKDRVTATVDADGNRSAVTLDAS